jgi:hypothetical protein
MRLYDIICEAPITDYQPIGDFDKPGSFNDKRDKKLIQNPINTTKLYKFFEKTNEDFRIFPINAPGLRKYSEKGAVDESWARQVLDKAVPNSSNIVLKDVDNSITIVYVSNTAAEKVVLTPWTMAHRFGHSVRASNMYAWKEAENYLFENINSILSDYYGLKVTGNKYNTQYTEYYNTLFNAIGTQRSSRQNLIKRPYEFLYELFTQFMMAGKVTLNPLPKSLSYGKPAYGRKPYSMSLQQDVTQEDADQAIYSLCNTMDYAFDTVLSECVGKIFFM